jgi:hypothetical protein
MFKEFIRSLPTNKNIEEENISLWQTAFAVKKLYGSYFGLAKNKMKNTVLLIFLITLNLLFILSLAALDTAFSSLMGILSLPNLSYSIFFQHSFQFFLAATSYQVNRLATSKVGRYIADRLSKEKNFMNQWIDNIGPDCEHIDMCQCSAAGRRETLYKIFSTFNSFLITLTSGLLSLYKLWLLATPLAFVLFSTPMTIPCYILVVSLLYPLLYNTLFSYMSHGYQDTLHQQKEQAKKLDDHVHRTLQNATKRNMKGNNAKNEKERFEQLEENEKKPALKHQALKELLSFLQDLYSELSVAAGIVFAAPMLITKTISIPTALLISDYFRRIANLFAWSQEKNDEIATITHDIHTLVECEKIFRPFTPQKALNRPITRQTPSNTSKDYILTIEDLSFCLMKENPPFSSTQTSPPRFYNHIQAMTLYPGNVVEVVGPNNCGKKKFLDILSPESEEPVRGLIYLPCDATRVLLISSLYLDPLETVATILEKALKKSKWYNVRNIQDIYQKFDLHKQHMDLLSSSSLSLQQRLNIILFIIYNPPNDLNKAPALILLDNVLHSIHQKERLKIITLLQTLYSSTALLHIHYDSPGSSCYTHCLFFENKDAHTGCIEISFAANKIIHRPSCQP